MVKEHKHYSFTLKFISACIFQRRPALEARIKELMEDAEKSTKTIPSPKSYVDKEPGADSSEEDPVMDDDELHSLLGV